jgi:hypothetical protein
LSGTQLRKKTFLGKAIIDLKSKINPVNHTAKIQELTQMLENIFIGLLFAGALGYIGNRLRKELSPKNRVVPKDAAAKNKCKVEWGKCKVEAFFASLRHKHRTKLSTNDLNRRNRWR